MGHGVIVQASGKTAIARPALPKGRFAFAFDVGPSQLSLETIVHQNPIQWCFLSGRDAFSMEFNAVHIGDALPCWAELTGQRVT
jgi:hypothetical protein